MGYAQNPFVAIMFKAPNEGACFVSSGDGIPYAAAPLNALRGLLYAAASCLTVGESLALRRCSPCHVSAFVCHVEYWYLLSFCFSLLRQVVRLSGSLKCTLIVVIKYIIPIPVKSPLRPAVPFSRPSICCAVGNYRAVRHIVIGSY
jgi:hypothetical protein